MKKSNLYLYGTDAVPEIPKEAITQRVSLLRAHLDKLQEIEMMDRPITQINAVVKAISFWEEMLYYE